MSSHPGKTEEHRNQKLLSVRKAVGYIQASYNTEPRSGGFFSLKSKIILFHIFLRLIVKKTNSSIKQADNMKELNPL